MNQGTGDPLASRPMFGRWFGSQFGRANPTDAGAEKALSFLLAIQLNQALGSGAHNPLVPGSSPGGPTMKIMGLCREAKGLESLDLCIAAATGPGPGGTLERWGAGTLAGGGRNSAGFQISRILGSQGRPLCPQRPREAAATGALEIKLGRTVLHGNLGTHS